MDVTLRIVLANGPACQRPGGPAFQLNAITHRPVASRLPRRQSQRLFVTRDTGFAGRLGGYARVTDKLDDGRVAVEFSAEADCAIAGSRYRIVNIRVGKFDDAKREGAN